MPELKPLNPERRSVPVPEAATETVELASPERRVPVPAKPASPKTASQSAGPVLPVPTPGTTRHLTPLQQEVENVLADGLADLYLSLTPAEQQVFKQEGEAAAIKISALLGQVKIKMAEILKLIREWLHTLPGLNKYFVEQTAKIKADKILKLH